MSWTQLLTDHLLTTTLALLAVWCATCLVKHPLARHLLWCALLIKFLLPPLVPVTVPWPNGSTTTPLAPPPAMAMPEPGQYASSLLSREDIPPEPTSARVEVETHVAPRRATVGPQNREVPAVSWPSMEQLLTTLLIAWGMGTFLVLMIAIRRAWRFQRLLNRTAMHDSALQAEVDELARGAGLKRPPTMLLTSASVSPMLWAVFRPTLIFPDELWRTLPAAERRTLLLHELAHLARRDHWVRKLELLVTLIWWWHPGVWLARRELHAAEEECCDAWVVARNAEGRRQYADALLATLDYLADPHPMLPPAACGIGRISRLERRMTMILHRPVNGLGRVARAVLAVALVALLGGSLTLADDVSADSQTPSTKNVQEPDSSDKDQEYFVTGRLTDAETGEPIGGATVHVLIDTDRVKVPIGTQITRTDVTDDKGRYRLAVPVGDGRIWGLELPSGYWADSATKMQSFLTTLQQPLARVDLEAKKGPFLNIRVRSAGKEGSLKNLGVSAIVMKPEPDLAAVGYTTTTARLDEHGRAKIVLPPGGTEYALTVGQRNPYIIKEVTIHGEKGFRLDNPGEVTGAEDRTVTDQEGRTLRVSAGTLSVRDGQLTLTVEVNPVVLPTRTVTGRVVNVDGEPIPEVRVGATTSTVGGGGAAAPVSTTTEEDGRFQFEITLLRGIEAFAGKDRQLGLLLTKDGYASTDTEPRPLTTGDEPIDFGTINLEPGHSIKVRVTNQAGEPVVGATVEPQGSSAARRQITRTDESGVAVLDGLPLGDQRVSVRWGELYENIHLFITKADNAAVEIRLAPKAEPTSEDYAAARAVKPIQVGVSAPELAVKSWSDGKERKLSDYRGKVVVLEFWNFGSSNWTFKMPAINELESRFADQGVVFLGIHAAGVGMSQVNNAREANDWNAPSAIDRGENLLQSETALAYGVPGRTTTIIIGRDGKVAFNSTLDPKKVKTAEDMMALMKPIALANDLAWPPPISIGEEAAKPSDEQIEKMKEWMLKMQVARLSHEIEKALEE